MSVIGMFRQLRQLLQLEARNTFLLSIIQTGSTVFIGRASGTVYA